MAVLPYLGAIKEPKSHNPINKKKPDVTFEMNYVHGYRSEETRQNCFFNLNFDACYMTAALGIILDTKENTQKFFGGGET
jgi:hypothetical protein